jgi:acetyl esterase/lipase
MKRQKTQKFPHSANGHWLKTKTARMVRTTIAGIVLLMALVLSFLFLSPKPFFYVFIQSGNAGRIPEGFSPPEGFEKIEKKSILYADNTYDSRYENSTYDIYLPTDIKNPPIFVFFHGGGFIQGDKQMAAYYGPAVAAEGYAVISVNYILAPSGTLHDQTNQALDFLGYLPDIALQYNLDINNIFVSGSSAGGYLAARTITALYNSGYASQRGLDLPRNLDIKGFILYSAPYEVSSIQAVDTNSLTRNLALYEVGWAITGNRRWRSDTMLGAEYDLYAHIVPGMPPLFVSDGNHNSFTQQAKKYARVAKEAGLQVTELFFDDASEVRHGYQMDMDSKEARVSFAEMLEFLAEHRK